MDLRRVISENIKNIRLRHGLSQSQLAERVKKSIRYISTLENNAQNVTIETLEAIAKGLGVSPIELLTTGHEIDSNQVRKARSDFDKALALLSRYRTIMDQQVQPPRRIRDSKK